MTPLAAEEELQVPGCYPYGVRASGSERSRHMRGGFVLWSIEKDPMLAWIAPLTTRGEPVPAVQPLPGHGVTSLDLDLGAIRAF